MTDFRYRPHQEETIAAVIEAYDAGAKAVVLEGPTGIGKSLVNFMVASERFGTAFYTTPLVPLVNQIRDDALLQRFPREVVYGKSNYLCALPDLRETVKAELPEVRPGTTVNLAPCELGTFKCPFSKPTDAGLPRCPYYHAKYAAARSPILVTTLAYLLVTTTKLRLADEWGLVKGRFPPRDLLVLDESHGTAEFVASHISVTVSDRHISDRYVPERERFKVEWPPVLKEALQVNDEPMAVGFLETVYLPLLQKMVQYIKSAVDEWRREKTPEGVVAQALKEWDALRTHIQSVETAVADMKTGNPWAVTPDPEEGTLLLQPVLVREYLKRRLWNRADRYLLTSATVLDPDLFIRDIGLEGEPYRFIRVPSTFPPERAPILALDVAKMSMDHKAAGQPKLLARFCTILDAERGRRGIVHCHSYPNAFYIRDHMPPAYRARLVFHGPKDRNVVFHDWLRRGDDAVLVSVAMTDGLDLKDDIARFAVIWKVPYPDLKDRRVQRRRELEDGRRWYDIQTLQAVIQASGRIVRSPEDEGRTYILDSSWGHLLRQTRECMPPWFSERLESGRSGGSS